jgi:hypothetical protein
MRLTRREHWLGACLVIFVMLWALFALGVRPALERIETLNRVIPEKQSELERLRIEAAEYVALHDRLSGLRTKIASQEETFELVPFAESLVQECGLTEHVVTMKQQVSQLEANYHETVVEIQMESLTLRQLLEFLLKLQSSKVLANTKRLYIKKNLTNTDLLDSIVEIRNLKPTESQEAWVGFPGSHWAIS